MLKSLHLHYRHKSSLNGAKVQGRPVPESAYGALKSLNPALNGRIAHNSFHMSLWPTHKTPGKHRCEGFNLILTKSLIRIIRTCPPRTSFTSWIFGFHHLQTFSSYNSRFSLSRSESLTKCCCGERTLSLLTWLHGLTEKFPSVSTSLCRVRGSAQRPLTEQQLRTPNYNLTVKPTPSPPEPESLSSLPAVRRGGDPRRNLRKSCERRITPRAFVSCCLSVRWRVEPARPAPHTRAPPRPGSRMSEAYLSAQLRMSVRTFRACLRPAVQSIGEAPGARASQAVSEHLDASGGGIITGTRARTAARTRRNTQRKHTGDNREIL